MHDDLLAAKPWLAVYGDAIPHTLAEPRYKNLGDLVQRTSATYAKQTAFTTVMANGMFGSLSFAEVEALSDDFAVYLREGVKLARGARVAIQTPNALTYPIVAFGVMKAGCVLVNTNPLYTPAEMRHQFADSGAEVLVVVDMFADKVAEVLAQTSIRRVVVASVPELFSAIPRAVIQGVQRFWNKALPPIGFEHVRLTEVLAEGRRLREAGRIEVAAYWRDVGPADLAALQYTGGTTGVSKGAMLTHANLLANIEQIIAISGGHIRPGQECVVTALPLYHIFAFTVNLCAFYERGARNILCPSPRPVQNLQRAIENNPVTWISGVNTLFNALLNEEWFVAYPPKTLRAAIAGGAALHKTVAEKWTRVTGTPLVEGYGLTECAPCVTFNPLDGRARPESIGVPVPGTSVRLVDDDARDVAAGAPGELIVSGPQVMAGYWQRPDETAKVIRDGWLFTGDVAVIDGDGFLRIVDRKKDMILVSGFNVYPNEIEEALSHMDDVTEAAVIGVPDERSGEAVRAYVVLREGATATPETVREFCRTRLTDYKVPKVVEVRTELPKTPVGKILRKDLRAEYLSKTKAAA